MNIKKIKPSIPGPIQSLLLEKEHPPWEEWKTHPDFSYKWVLSYLKRQKAIPREDLELIARETLFIHHYGIIAALVKRREFPQSLLLRFVETLRWADILSCLRLNYIAISAKTAMINNLVQRFPFFTLGEKITIAKKAPRLLVLKLRTECNQKVFQVLIKNPNFTHTDALFVASNPALSPQILSILANCSKWIPFKDIKFGLLRNPSTPRACYRGLLEGLDTYELKSMLHDGRIPQFAKVLAKSLLSRG